MWWRGLGNGGLSVNGVMCWDYVMEELCNGGYVIMGLCGVAVMLCWGLCGVGVMLCWGLCSVGVMSCWGLCGVGVMLC